MTMDSGERSEFIQVINDHLEQLEIEAEKYQELIGEFDIEKGPDDWKRLENMADRLHNFYMGVEQILERIAKRIDEEGIPEGPRWHQKLLKQMSSPTDQRPSVFSDETRRELLDFLQFRHFYRRGYGDELKWEEMRDLVKQFENIYKKTVQAIEEFIGEISDD